MDVIVSHVNADFDSLGGMIGPPALPGAVMVSPPGKPARARLPVAPPGDLPRPIRKRSIGGDHADRGGGYGEQVEARPRRDWLARPGVEVHLYDHHPGEGDIRAAVEVRDQLGSVCALIAEQLRQRGLAPTPTEATALLLGSTSTRARCSSPARQRATSRRRPGCWSRGRPGGRRGVRARALSPEQRALLRDWKRLSSGGTSAGSWSRSPWPGGEYIADTSVLVNR